MISLTLSREPEWLDLTHGVTVLIRPLTAAIFSEFVLGEPIPLGTEKRFVAATDGQLMLRCADDWTQLGDNDGELNVAVRRAE